MQSRFFYMKILSRTICVWVCTVVVCAATATAFAADKPAATPHAPKPLAPSDSLLPKQFSGWTLQATAKTSRDPAVADPVNSPVLKEYGFTDFESGTYVRDDGNKLTLRAARFGDASGAYGAFTFYKTPEMLNEKIGDQASSLNNRVLFYRGNVLVDAVFDHLTAMSAADLRELASSVLQPTQGSGKLPGLPALLPRQGYVKNTARYIMGPAALDRVGGPISSQQVDFNAGAEVVLGNYTTSAGEVTLMLINYPTPQIAAQHLRQIEASRQSTGQSEAATPSGTPPVYDRRTGPIVVVVAGALPQSEAKSLLASVNYDADVTWNEATTLADKDNLAKLLVNIIILSFILVGLALVAGVAFGGVRILINAFFPSESLIGRRRWNSSPCTSTTVPKSQPLGRKSFRMGRLNRKRGQVSQNETFTGLVDSFDK